MAGTKHPREGYGSTSEQRQRGLSGDTFSERSARTSDERDAARATPDEDRGGHVVHVKTSAAPDEEPDGT
jgi:hypothetical protein